MSDLTTTYMGLTLKNPLIASSSTMTANLKSIKKLADAGVGAIILQSLFEEEILGKAEQIIDSGGGANVEHSSQEYISYYTKQNSVHGYLELITKARKEVPVPVIASINCVTDKEWIEFAKKIEDAGADALEVNIFFLPANDKEKRDDIEKRYLSIAKSVTAAVSIPVALKLSTYFTNLAKTFVDLSYTGISSLVVFNRFYNPDIHLDDLRMKSSSVFSSPSDLGMPLRWIGILSNKVQCDLAASTGIHDGDGLIKVLLVGAKVAQCASVFYQKKPEYAQTMLKRLKGWMKDKKFNTIDEFRGKLSQEKIGDPVTYERSQFMKYFSRFEK